MSASVNKVILVGNLGRDPEVKTFNNGDRIVNLSVATSENWKDKATGERKDRTEWHRVVIQNDQICQIAEKYLRKGSKVYIEGCIRSRTYESAERGQQSVTEVVVPKFNGTLTLLDGKQDDSAPAKTPVTTPRKAPAKPADEPFDDEIPF